MNRKIPFATELKASAGSEPTRTPKTTLTTPLSLPGWYLSASAPGRCRRDFEFLAWTRSERSRFRFGQGNKRKQ